MTNLAYNARRYTRVEPAEQADPRVRLKLWAKLEPGQALWLPCERWRDADNARASAYAWARREGVEMACRIETNESDNSLALGLSGAYVLIVMRGTPARAEAPPRADARETPNPAPLDIQPGLIDLNDDLTRGAFRGRPSKYNWNEVVMDTGAAGYLIPFTHEDGDHETQTRRIRLAGYAWAKRAWQRLRFVAENEGVRVYNVTSIYE